MTPHEFHATRRFAQTSHGRIAYIERGVGPAALFIHGVPVNGYHWRHQLTGLCDLRRCIAPDLMGLGYTEVGPDQDLSFEAQAEMLLELMDFLGARTFDIVANDSGGAIAQILATRAPDRVNSLTLTNCDVHDNWPPEALSRTMEQARAGQLGQAMALLLAQPMIAKSKVGLGAAFEFPERLTHELLQVYLGPIVSTPERQRQLDKYFTSFDCRQTLGIHQKLKELNVPTLIVWADGDVFFSPRWAHWLGATLPDVRKIVELTGACLFFPEERPDEFTPLVREHWLSVA